MLHPSLLSVFPFPPPTCSSLSFPPPSSLPYPPPLPLLPCSYSSSQKEEETEMKRLGGALKNRFRLEVLRSDAEQQGFVGAGEVGWAVEPSALFGEDFSVDELLDFGGIMEMEEKEAEEEDEEEQVERAEAEPFQISNSTSAVSRDLLAPAEIEFPNDDVEELEWVSHFFDDSFMELSPCSEITAPSSKRPSPSADSMESLAPVKAKRSKRSRAAAGGVWSTAGPLALPDTSSSTSSNSCLSSPSSSSSSSSSCLIYDSAVPGFATTDLVLLAGTPPSAKKDSQKKRGRKPKRPKLQSAAAGGGGGGGDRRCSHCGIQKTPQWRAGPLGAKTLCNACGVRFKSGRLLPEYRPACSPTFLSHVHSNSHRKVLEMRRQKEEKQQKLLSTSTAAAAEAVPVSSF
ncbi:GATA transcription factor 7 [Elaeis guineensis]|uniref:GATA transcription factor 6 n=1 Tax=Elaeis guineensis var. tenera TaxID=51953 RepID=A0A6I9QB57_ELAGV|nr:GATA transcription factor 6 [Elaeis guineensis]